MSISEIPLKFRANVTTMGISDDFYRSGACVDSLSLPEYHNIRESVHQRVIACLGIFDQKFMCAMICQKNFCPEFILYDSVVAGFFNGGTYDVLYDEAGVFCPLQTYLYGTVWAVRKLSPSYNDCIPV